MKKIICLLAFGVWLSGCTAFISDYYVSKPIDTRDNYKGWSNGVVKIQLENIRVYLKPDNPLYFGDGAVLLPYIPIAFSLKENKEKYRKGKYIYQTGDERGIYYKGHPIEGDYFYVELSMRADKEGFVFNPRQVYLELENGENIQASKYLKPEFKLGAPNPNWGVGSMLMGSVRDMKSWRLEENEQSISEYFELPKGKWRGFAVRFETPTPNPGTPFAIEIKGLKYSQDLVSIPKIRFKDKKRYREIRN